MLQKYSEKDLTKKFLIPLFESKGMGYKNVRYTHRVLEFGKDIICYKEDLEDREYTAVQVKITKISKSNTGPIVEQIREAFGEPFTGEKGEKKRIDRFIVLTSDEITEEAKDSMWAQFRTLNLDRLIKFIDDGRLVDFLDKHMPSAFWDEYDYFNKYCNAMKKDFEEIKDISAIGQKESIPLENIFVSLRVCEKVTEREIPLEKERKIFEEKWREIKEERREEKTRILDAERAVKDFNKLVIVGVPGSGKTTLLKYIALKSCKENLDSLERTSLPIPINLRVFLESGKILREFIDCVFEKYEFPKAKSFIEKDLKEGKARLLLDGFDELATRENQEKISKEILSFVGKYPSSQFVVTSRIAGYHDELKGFDKLELMEFDDKQIEQFIRNWFGKTDPEKAKSMSAEIRKNEQVKAIARNPLMIAIIAIIYEEGQKLPEKRAALYERCVDVLLSKLDVKKRIQNKYSSDIKVFLLKKLAFYGHCNNKRIFTEQEVIAEMLKHFPRLGLQKSDAEPILDEIWKRSYLLRQISRDSYDFLHLSFQEYFTALELKDDPKGMETIVKHLSEPWWEEPILLYAGINKDAGPLINKIKADVKEDIFYNNLMLFGKCIAVAEFTEPKMKIEISNGLCQLYNVGEFRSLKDKAIRVLALIKPDHIIDQLINDLNKKDSSVRWSAAYALGSIGSEKAIDPLIKALTTAKDSYVRWSAADALGRIEDKRAINALLKALKDKDSSIYGSIKDQAFIALEKICRKNKIRIPLDSI